MREEKERRLNRLKAERSRNLKKWRDDKDRTKVKDQEQQIENSDRALEQPVSNVVIDEENEDNKKDLWVQHKFVKRFIIEDSINFMCCCKSCGNEIKLLNERDFF